MIEAKHVNALLTTQIDQFLAHLYGSNPAYERGGIWSMASAQGGSGESLKIWPDGSWKDFATGAHGDLITLTTLALGIPFADALGVIQRFLGLNTDTTPTKSMEEVESAMAKLQSRPEAKPTPGVQWKPLPKGSPFTNPSATYTYHTKDGTPIFIVGRWEATPTKKKFFQIASYRQEGWVMKAPDISLWPLLDEPKLLLWPTDRPTILVEGEKAATWGQTNLPQYFWTTWHGGSSAVKRTDFISLEGRITILWPDADAPGAKAMEYVHSQLPEALVVVPDEKWDEGTDVADLSKEDVLGVIEATLAKGVTVTREPERTIAPSHTEPNQLGSTYRFLDRYGPDLRFTLEGKLWSFWDGRRWSVDRGGYTWSRGVATVEQSFSDCLPWTNGDSKKLNRIENYQQVSKNTAHIRGVIDGASQMQGVAVSEGVFDLDADLINLTNGILDLRTGRLMPHDRDKMMSKLVGHPYEKGAQCPMFLGFLKEIMCGDQEVIDFLQIYFGYSLTGLPPDRIFAIFYGAGRNGKSTLIQIISEILGEYHVTIRSQSIMSGKDNERPDKIGEDLIPLRGARLATMQESDRGTKLNEGKIKEMTGRDAMRCRYLHSNLWLQFVNSAKLILTTNHKPRVTGNDPGIWDRIAMVEFGARIPEEKLDPDLSAKIIEQEAPGVLAWMVEGAMKFYANGKKIERPKAVKAATDEYRSDEDLLGKFVDATICENKHGRLKVSSIQECYRKWMEANGDGSATLGSRRFAEDLRQVMERYGYQRKKTADGTYYFGCGFLEDEEQEARSKVRQELPAHWSDTRDDLF